MPICSSSSNARKRGRSHRPPHAFGLSARPNLTLATCTASRLRVVKQKVSSVISMAEPAPPEEVLSRPLPTWESSVAKSSRRVLATFKSSVSKPSVKVRHRASIGGVSG